MQTRVNLTCYVNVPICSDESVNLMFGFANNNRLHILELYLNSRSKRENFFNMKFNRVLSYT